MLFLVNVLIDRQTIALQVTRNFVEDAQVSEPIDVVDDFLVDEHVFEHEVEERLGQQRLLLGIAGGRLGQEHVAFWKSVQRAGLVLAAQAGEQLGSLAPLGHGEESVAVDPLAQAEAEDGVLDFLQTCRELLGEFFLPDVIAGFHPVNKVRGGISPLFPNPTAEMEQDVALIEQLALAGSKRGRDALAFHDPLQRFFGS